MKLSAAVVRALVLGVLMGLTVAVMPSCGPVRRPVTCNASNCPGCCDENANCFTGLADVACGNGGQTCTACSSGQTCVAMSTGADAGTGGRCLTGGMGGGAAGGAAAGGSAAGGAAGGRAGGSAGGAATCNAQNCPNGCCTTTGSCQNPPVTSRCGMGGAACMMCRTGQSCVNGACTPCNGCVDLATGRCEQGTTDALCGKNGDYCVNCGVSSGVCTNQTCTGSMPACNATNCPTGCCDQGSSMCIQPAQQTGMQCGQGVPGSLCAQCGSNMCTTNDAGIGECIGGAGGGAGGGFGGGLPNLDGGFLPGGCDANNPCPSGQCCATLVGICVSPIPFLLPACGMPAVCCNGLQGEMCTNGVCQ